MTAIQAFTGSGAEWDAFVRRSGGWTHYQLFGWKHVLERVFGHACHYFAARDETGALCGVLPLVRVRSAVFGDYLVSMPFVNYGGPLGTPESVAALTRTATDLARNVGCDLLELRARDKLALDLDASHRKLTVLLDLPHRAEQLWHALEAKVRSQVRRPQKEGVTVRFGLDEMQSFFRVYSRHMRDLGTPTQPRRLFEALVDQFSESVWFGVAYLQERPIAAGCGFTWGDEFELAWAAALREHNRLAPNMLLYWRFIERCVDAGLRIFNFGRCTPDSGTHRFKRQWGGRDHALWWYQVARRRAATPSPDDSTFRWGPRIWQHLPVRVATALGPQIVRFIP